MSTPDNVTANAGSGGATFRSFSDGTAEWPASIVAYVTGGSAGAWTLQQVDATHGLPVSVLNASLSVTVGAALPAGTATIGGVELVDAAGANKASISAAGALKVDGSAVTQPVSGTVTANAGTGNFAANITQIAGVAAGLTNPLAVELSDGTNLLGTATHPVRTDPTGTTAQPVSGTITANQGGTWSVNLGTALPAGTATIGGVELVDSAGVNKAAISTAGAVKVDGSAVTQPVSGTITANAGSGTFATSDAADGPVTPGAAAAKSMLIGAQYNTSAPAPTTGQQVALQTDASGNLKVNVAAGGAAGGTSSSFSAAFPATGTAAGASDGTNMKPLLVDASGNLKVNVMTGGGSGSNAAASATGSAVPADADYQGLNVAGTLRGQTGVNPTGTVYAAQTDLSSVGGTTIVLGQATMASSVPVAIASNQSVIPVSQSGTWTVTANAGTGTFGVSGTVTANIGTTNGLALDATLTGGSQKAAPVASTSGGATPYHLVSAATTNATSVKGSAGTVYGIQAFNVNASPRFLKLFDKATAPTLGTDLPVKTILLPGNASGAGATMAFPVGVSFVNGIALAITGGMGDADTTAVGASDCVISLDYK